MILKSSRVAPLVSVVMPSYNSEEFIAEAIESVLNQTYQNIELIIVDDYSTDHTTSIITRFAAQDSRVIPIFKKLNEGAAKARNVALDLAKGEFIAFLDSDDIWNFDKLEIQLTFMFDHDCRFCFSYYDVINSSGNYCYSLKAPKIATNNKLLFTCFIGCSSVVIARSLLGNTRQRNIFCRNDYMFWLDILKDGEIGYCCPSVLLSYRKGSGISSNKLRNFKFYCYVIKNATSFGSFLLPFTVPIFLTINLVKKRFPSFYNKIIVRI